MAKVEMSLQEYDQMKKLLNVYEEIINVITTPNIDEWDIHYYNNGCNFMPVYSNDITKNLSKDAQSTLKSLCYSHVYNYLADNNIEGEFKLDLKVSFGDVDLQNRVEEEKEE